MRQVIKVAWFCHGARCPSTNGDHRKAGYAALTGHGLLKNFDSAFIIREIKIASTKLFQ